MQMTLNQYAMLNAGVMSDAMHPAVMDWLKAQSEGRSSGQYIESVVEIADLRQLNDWMIKVRHYASDMGLVSLALEADAVSDACRMRGIDLISTEPIDVMIRFATTRLLQRAGVHLGDMVDAISAHDYIREGMTEDDLRSAANEFVEDLIVDLGLPC